MVFSFGPKIKFFSLFESSWVVEIYPTTRGIDNTEGLIEINQVYDCEGSKAFWRLADLLFKRRLSSSELWKHWRTNCQGTCQGDFHKTHVSTLGKIQEGRWSQIAIQAINHNGSRRICRTHMAIEVRESWGDGCSNIAQLRTPVTSTLRKVTMGTEGNEYTPHMQGEPNILMVWWLLCIPTEFHHGI